MMKVTSTSHIPSALAEHRLNLRAFLDLPPKDLSLEEEVKAHVDGAMTGFVTREHATRSILAVIGRELGELEAAFRKALNGRSGGEGDDL